MERTRIPELVQKFLQGNCSGEERKELLRWWHATLEDDTYINGLSPEDREALQYRILESIRHEIRIKESQQGMARPFEKSKVVTLNYRHYIVAASLSILAIAIVLHPWFLDGKDTITTEYGESRNVMLPDGSEVVLNGNSSLTFDTKWDSSSGRNVWMEGEAYFQVVHTRNHSPFVVHTSQDLRIEVLGTKFNVNDRRGVTEVVLDEGRVKVENDSGTYIMEPDEMITYSQQQPTFIPVRVNADEKISWKEKVLIFEDEPLHRIASRLADGYGLKIVFEDTSLAKQTFTGSVPTDSVTLFLDKIEKLYHVEISHEHDIYIVR